MSANNYQGQSDKVVARRKQFQLVCEDESLTVQAEAEACDVNNIMARYRQTGLIDHVNKHEGRYGDFTDVTDFQSAMNLVASAQQSFALLPAEIRKQFDNDPAEFLGFVQNPKNQDKLVEMGLAVKKAPEEPTAARAKAATQEPASASADASAASAA